MSKETFGKLMRKWRGGRAYFKKTWPLWLVAREYSRFVGLSLREMENRSFLVRAT